MHILAAIIAEAFGNYPVTASTRSIERKTITVAGSEMGFVVIGDRDCLPNMVYGLPRSSV